MITAIACWLLLECVVSFSNACKHAAEKEVEHVIGVLIGSVWTGFAGIWLLTN